MSNTLAIPVPMVPLNFFVFPKAMLSATIRPCLLAGPARGIFHRLTGDKVRKLDRISQGVDIGVGRYASGHRP